MPKVQNDDVSRYAVVGYDGESLDMYHSQQSTGDGDAMLAEESVDVLMGDEDGPGQFVSFLVNMF